MRLEPVLKVLLKTIHCASMASYSMGFLMWQANYLDGAPPWSIFWYNRQLLQNSKIKFQSIYLLYSPIQILIFEFFGVWLILTPYPILNTLNQANVVPNLVLLSKSEWCFAKPCTLLKPSILSCMTMHGHEVPLVIYSPPKAIIIYIKNY